MVELIIKNGLVFLEGEKFEKVDIGISDGKIAKIGNLKNLNASEVIDADGFVVSPGFIDMHSHDDFALTSGKPLLYKTYQGITTEVTGNCGISGAPLNERTDDFIKVNIAIIGNTGGKILWNSWDEFIETLKRANLSLNVVPLTGHGNLRLVSAGKKEKLNRDEIEKMKRNLEEIMKKGGWGFSTGLIYSPGIFSSTDEIVSLAEVVSKYGGIYSTHIRGEGDTVIEAVKEACFIGEKAGVFVEISHLKCAGMKNWGKMDEVIKIIEEEKDVNFDVYPYTAGATHISALLPPSIRKKENIKELLSDVGVREKVKKEMLEDRGEWENFLLNCGAEKIIISSVNSEKNREIEGKNLKEISEMKRKDVVECILDIVTDEDGMAGIIVFSMSESNVKKLIKHKKGFIGTDGLPGKHPHPRLWGTFPRILRKYVREEKLISLKDALYKFTKGPAEKLGLKKRGEIREGYFADIVIFDPDRVKDNASFSNPEVKPDGIPYVIVNGEVIISNGEFTGKTSGKVLLKT